MAKTSDIREAAKRIRKKFIIKKENPNKIENQVLEKNTNCS